MKIGQVRRQSGLELAQAEQKASTLEQQYITTRDEVTRRDLQYALHEVMFAEGCISQKITVAPVATCFRTG